MIDLQEITVSLTLKEIAMLEEVLWEKADVLSKIADIAHYKNKRLNGDALDAKAKRLEDLARKIGEPLDAAYLKKMNIKETK